MSFYKKLLLNWKEPSPERKNYLVGIIEKKPNEYVFRYIKPMLDQAKEKGFTPIIGLSEEDKVYRSEKLFSIFERRLPGSNRTVFKKLLKEYGLSNEEDAEWDYLSISKGKLATDGLSFLAPAVYENGALFLNIEVAGWSHTKAANKSIEKDIEVQVHIEIDNKHDSSAVIINDLRSNEMLGYIPRPYNELFYRLLKKGHEVVGKIYSLNKQDGRPSIVLGLMIEKELLEQETDLQYLIEYQ
ncbi:HIRAN domain-containing protein [Paenibacillus medicaginis]|uniref:HIRAN domain-containing protein n=1 Tax=Paenibacillus medicaginis TaxID=1470560 RepID=A0ABV5C0V9_9BACL